LISRGELITGGATGIVERLPSGDAIKTPWNGDTGDLCRQLALESQIYKRLGYHPRLVKIISWDPDQYALTMEYMPNGSLRDRLADKDISLSQRLQWAQQAAEAVQLLHASNVIHCDVAPRNFLLDADLSLKIVDFAGSSLDSSPPSACGTSRFTMADFPRSNPPTIQEDMFALGSTIYCIMTSRRPYEELTCSEVKDRYRAQDFPDVSKIACGEIILRCWRSEVTSAQEVYDYIRSME
jgi:serine/threonine protein kinase